MRLKHLAISLIGATLFIIPFISSADQISDIQAQIQRLLAQLKELQSAKPSVAFPESDDYPYPTPGQACPNLTSTFQRGARDATTGGQVSELQIFLANTFDLNEEDIVTGYFGKTTERYVMEFQKKYGLPAYGIVGSLTRAKIRDVCSGSVTTPICPAEAAPSGPNCTLPSGGQGVWRHVPPSGNQCGGWKCVSPNNPADDPQCKRWTDGKWCGTICSRSETEGTMRCVTPSCVAPVEGVGAPDGPPRCLEYFSGTSNKSPVISSFSGPTTLEVNQQGTWTIKASDPENRQLSYNIHWGDEREPYVAAKSAMDIVGERPFTQNTSFTHSYSRPGVYTITIVVKNDYPYAGNTAARTTTTVRVSGETVKCGVNSFSVQGAQCGNGGYTDAWFQCHDGFTGNIGVQDSCAAPDSLLRSAQNACTNRCGGPDDTAAASVIRAAIEKENRFSDVATKALNTVLACPAGAALDIASERATLDKAVAISRAAIQNLDQIRAIAGTNPREALAQLDRLVAEGGVHTDKDVAVMQERLQRLQTACSSAVEPRVNISVYYDSESTNENRTKINLITQGMRQCDILKGNRPGGSNSAGQFAQGEYSVLMSNVGAGGVFGSPESIIKIINPEPSMMIAARCTSDNGVQYFSNTVAAYKVFPNRDPVGYFDSVSASAFSGWACDYNNYAMALDIHFYTDGPAGTGTFIGGGKAYTEREKAVADLCGNVAEHGFVIPLSSMSTAGQNLLRDGRSHSIYAYAINIPMGNNPLLGVLPSVQTGDPARAPEALTTSESQLAAAYASLKSVLETLLKMLKGN